MKLLFLLLSTLLLPYVHASDFALIPFKPNIQNQAQLQRGAKVFMNYCSGCHSLRYLRYSRMAKDLGLTTFDGAVDSPLLKNNLIFTTATIYDPIRISLPETMAHEWFGRMPPDLSLTAREKGPSWIYTFLKSFYLDPKRPFNANNLLVPDTSMPNILSPLSGIYQMRMDTNHLAKLILVKEGSMSTPAFDATLKDVITFLTYVAEPNKLERITLGYKVVAFLLLWFVILWLLYKSYLKKQNL